MKKGRHRRYEEARKFQRESAQRFDVSEYDFDDDSNFGLSSKADGDGDGHYDDQYSDLAAKYNVDDEADLEADHDERTS